MSLEDGAHTHFSWTLYTILRENMNQLYLILLLFIISSCEIEPVDFAFDSNNIPEEIKDRVSALKLLNSEERLLAAVYERSINVPSYEITDEELLLLTDKRFLRYYDFDNEGFIQEIEFNKCLDITLDFDSIMLNLDRVKFDIRAITIHDVFYNEKEKRLNLIPDFKYVHYGGNIRYQANLDSLNSMILDTWKNQNSYDSLRTIYSTFYDEKE